VDSAIYGLDDPFQDRKAVLEVFLTYVQTQQEAGVALNHMSRHILGLFQGMPGARAFRRLISENAHKPNAGVELLVDAAKKIA
jgi:tRNA-dihydrouridine synthase A